MLLVLSQEPVRRRLPSGLDEVAVGVLEALAPFLFTWVLVDLSVGLPQEPVRRRLPSGLDEVAVGILKELAPFLLTWVLVDL